VKLTRKDLVRLLLLWLGGIDLRLTLLAVPPLIPLIHHDLHLDEKSVGALVSLPILLLALASVPGALLIAKLGIRGALITGLGLVAIFGALRGAGSSPAILFSATFLMGLGVAVSQPAFPSLVREWFPARIAIATAVYSNGILIGETLPVTFTTPVGVLPIAHGDWAYADPEDDLWYVLGRSDDTIKVAGKRLGPAEVESVLVGHPSVAEAAAIGVPDELKGEALVCFVILLKGKVASDELAHELSDLIATALGKPLRPKAVHFVTDLPRTRNAKILRRVVRSVYTGKDPGDLSSLENPSALAAIGATRS